MTKDYPQLVTKCQEKRGGNVHMVTMEKRGKGTPNIFIVTRGCVCMEGDAFISSENK